MKAGGERGVKGRLKGEQKVEETERNGGAERTR